MDKLDGMHLKSIRIQNFDSITDTTIDFCTKSKIQHTCFTNDENQVINIANVITSNYKYALRSISTILEFISCLRENKFLSEVLKSTFTEQITTITIVFRLDKTDYKYQLQLNDSYIIEEALFENNFLSDINTFSLDLLYLKNIAKFLKSIFIINLNDDALVKDLINTLIDRCDKNDDYIKIVGSYLKALKLSTKDPIFESKNSVSSIYIFNETEQTFLDVFSSNQAIQIALASAAFLFPCLTFPSVIIITDFGNLSFTYKERLLQFFTHASSTGSSKSQLLVIDFLDTIVYESSEYISNHFHLIEREIDDTPCFIFNNTK